MSRQGRSLETGRDKKETHLILLKQAHGDFFVTWEGKTGGKTPGKRRFERGVLRADRKYMYAYLCMYVQYIVPNMYMY